MATPTATRQLSYSEVVATPLPIGLPPPIDLPPPIEAPFKVGELVYATVLAESPMSAFRLLCTPDASPSEKRQVERAAKARKLDEERGEIGEKGPRPCIILSTKQLTTDRWEYELCLLTSFDDKAYNQLPPEEKRLALPVYHGDDQPTQCEVETTIRAFVLKPPMKKPPVKPPVKERRPDSCAYIIGYPITRSSGCITSTIGDVKPVMDSEEVERLKKQCDWIKKHKGDVSSK